MKSRIYIRGGFDGEVYAMADVTRHVDEGAELLINRFAQDAIRLKNPPQVINTESIVLINKAMTRVGDMMMPEPDKPELKRFNSQNKIKYLETTAHDSSTFYHRFEVEFMSPSGLKIYLYPKFAVDNDNFNAVGNLINIAECYPLYHPCPNYLENLDLSFLSNPDKY